MADDPDHNMNDKSENDCTDIEAMPDFDQQTAGGLVDPKTDFDAEIRRFFLTDSESEPDAQKSLPTPESPVTQASTPSRHEDVSEEETAEWKSMRQLTMFKNWAKVIEDSVLKER